jgi:hypothetical protein
MVHVLNHQYRTLKALSPSDSETRLNSLRMKLSSEPQDDLRKEGTGLKDRFIRDFEQEMLLAEAFASRQDLVETVYNW